MQEALRASEERFRAIVDQQTDLICRFRPDTTLTFVNDAYARHFGIAADELSTVRRKFTRGRMARADGSGLGLAIVSRIVGDHKGTLVLESELGTGTSAQVYLPVAGD